AGAFLVDDRDVAGPVAIEVVFETEACAPAREADGLPRARLVDRCHFGGRTAAGHQRRGQGQVGAADAVPQRVGVGGDVVRNVPVERLDLVGAVLAGAQAVVLVVTTQ